MKKNRLKIATFLISVLTLIAGCTSSFEEVNTDPDRPTSTQVPSTNVLAYCLRYASDNLFDEWFDLNESCGFSGQVSKLMYTEEGYYAFRPTVNNTSWSVCYLVESNLQDIIEKSETDGAVNMKAVATIFQTQIMQIITDRWRDVPYSEMCRFDEGILQPAYDSQEDIYPAMLVALKTAADDLNEGATDELGDGDVLFDGDLTAWKRYCNSLRLRIAMRISGVSETLAKETIEEILSNPTEYPIIESNDQNAFFNWGNEYAEPWADYYNTRPDEYGISELMVNTLDSLDDPRLSVYALPTASSVAAGTSEYIGYPNGLEAYATVSQYSKIGTKYMQDLSGFTPWFRACENYFIIAEAAKKGWNTSGMTAEEAYETAITLSLEENEVDATAISTYLAGGGKYDGTDEQLYTQLWISLFKQGMEAWSSYRRTGYPTANKIAPDSAYPNHNTPPLRYPYPDTESNLNPVNSAAAAANIVDDFWGTPMWWDQRNADE